MSKRIIKYSQGKKYIGKVKLDELTQAILDLLLPACTNNEILFSVNGIWQISSKIRAYDDLTSTILRLAQTSKIRATLSATDVVSQLALTFDTGKALSANANTSLSNILLRNTEARLQTISGGYNTLLGSFANVAQLQLVNAADNSQYVLQFITNGNTVFSVLQNGSLFASGLKLNIPNLANGKILGIDGAGEVTAIDKPQGTTFISLSDTPASYIANKWLKVNSAGDALIFVDPPSGGNGQLPANTLFVSPAFNNVAPFYSDLETALNNVPQFGTVVIYDGYYDKADGYDVSNCHLHCMGQSTQILKLNVGTAVTIDGNPYVNIMDIQGDYASITMFNCAELNILGHYNDVSIIGDCNTVTLLGTRNNVKCKDILNLDGSYNSYDKIEARHIATADMNNSITQIIAYSMQTLNIQNNSKINADIKYLENVSTSYSSELFLNADEVRTMGIQGELTKVKANIKLLKRLEVNQGDSNSIIRAMKYAGNDINLAGGGKVKFENTIFEFNVNYKIRMEESPTLILDGCYLRGNADSIIYVGDYDSLSINSSVIINNNTSGKSIEIASNINPANVYVRGECYANTDVSPNVNYIIGTLNIEPNAIGEPTI